MNRQQSLGGGGARRNLSLKGFNLAEVLIVGVLQILMSR